MNFKMYSLASGFACGFLLMVCFTSHWLDATKHGVTITPTFHIGIFHGRICFYRNEWPYNGGLIQLDNEPPLLEQSHLDFPGIYYRYFRFPEEIIHTFKVSLWYPIVALSFLPVAYAIHQRHDNSHSNLLGGGSHVM